MPQIIKAWNDKRPLLGVRIHGLRDKDGYTASRGADPFESISMTVGRAMANNVELIDPVGGDSRAVYRDIENNLEGWVNHRAYRRS